MKIRQKIKFFKIDYQMSYLNHMQYYTKSNATNIAFLNMHVSEGNQRILHKFMLQFLTKGKGQGNRTDSYFVRT